MIKSFGFIEVDLLPPDINSLDHPEVIRFKELLEETAEEYDCTLCCFDINNGIITFSFDNEELMAKILSILRNDKQS